VYDQQAYYQNQQAYYQNQYGDDQQDPNAQSWGNPANRAQQRQQYGANARGNLQYDQRDAERILREQLSRSRQQAASAPQQMYDSYYGHRIQDEGQVARVMDEARSIAGVLVKNRNGKPFVAIDKRNYQFYLYDQNGGLLRIGPVAIGKGRTQVGAFETPTGIFPIRSKIPVDDWIRPDWYFVEEGEPIPKRWEDRKVPGFFRYKLVFDGSRYIHYAEATGGRLTHGCLGLDWEDAEAVFHTLQVGSNCIVLDGGLLSRLARGEWPVQKQAPKPKLEEVAVKLTANSDTERPPAEKPQRGSASEQPVMENLW
jgi:lipoprotein-anchoring transpeptidase ErfK/SrfK